MIFHDPELSFTSHYSKLLRSPNPRTELNDFGKEILANCYPMSRKPTQLFALKAFSSTSVLCNIK